MTATAVPKESLKCVSETGLACLEAIRELRCVSSVSAKDAHAIVQCAYPDSPGMFSDVASALKGLGEAGVLGVFNPRVGLPIYYVVNFGTIEIAKDYEAFMLAVLRALRACEKSTISLETIPRTPGWVASEMIYGRYKPNHEQTRAALDDLAAEGKVIRTGTEQHPSYRTMPAGPLVNQAGPSYGPVVSQEANPDVLG